MGDFLDCSREDARRALGAIRSQGLRVWSNAIRKLCDFAITAKLNTRPRTFSCNAVQ